MEQHNRDKAGSQPRKVIKVAVGVLFNAEQKVLIGQRVKQDAFFAKWEFPGGKLERGETAEQALQREFEEEVGLKINTSSEFMVREYSYPDRDVKLFVRTISDYEGEAVAQEGQALQWVGLEDIANLDFLSGNKLIIERLLHVYG